MLVSQIARLIVTTKSPTLSRLYQRSYQIASEIYCLLSPNFRKLLNEYEDGHYSLNTYPPFFSNPHYIYPPPAAKCQLTTKQPLPNRALVDPSHYPIRTADSYCNWQIRRVQGHWRSLPSAYCYINWPHRFYVTKCQSVRIPRNGSYFVGLPKPDNQNSEPVWFERSVSETYSTISTYRRGRHCLDVIPNSAYNWYKITS